MLTALFNPFRKSFDKWLFHLSKRDRGDVYLNQRHVFIVPSKPGLAFTLMLLILFITSTNYNLSLGFALTFVTAGCALVDMHLTFRNLGHLTLSPGKAQPVFACEEAQFELHLINRRRYARHAIWLGVHDKDHARPEQALDIAANTSCKITISAQTIQRGWMAAPRVRLQTRFPLGLFRAWSYWMPDTQVMVYPYPEAIPAPFPCDGESSTSGSGQSGQLDFSGIRGYQSGDSLRQLAWRQIAKLDLNLGGLLVTKNFEEGVSGDLCLNFAKLPGSMDLEMRLSRMTRWVIEAESLGLDYSFWLSEIEFCPSKGPAHMHACLQALAMYQGK